MRKSRQKKTTHFSKNTVLLTIMTTTRVHLLSSERDTKSMQWLTVLIRVEILLSRVSRAEEEDSSIDGDEGRDEREDFQFIETPGDVGSAVEGVMEVDQ